MIIEIILTLRIFLLIFFLSVIALGNSFFLLDGGYYANPDDKVVAESWYMTLIATYTTGLGDFGTDDYGKSAFTGTLWVFFFVTTVLITIVLLNLIIAFMGDSFDKVQEIRDQA